MQAVAAIARQRRRAEVEKASAAQAAQRPMLASSEAEATAKRVLEEGTQLFEALQRDQDTLARSTAGLNRLTALVRRLESTSLNEAPKADKAADGSDVRVAQLPPRVRLGIDRPTQASSQKLKEREGSVSSFTSSEASPFGPVVTLDAAEAVLSMPLGQAENLERRLRFTYRSHGMSPYMVRLKRESIRLTRQVDKFSLLNRKLRDSITELRRQRTHLRVARDTVQGENDGRMEELQQAMGVALAATRTRESLEERRDTLARQLQSMEESFRHEWEVTVSRLDKELLGIRTSDAVKSPSPVVKAAAAAKAEATKSVMKKKLAKTRWKVLRDKQGMAKVESELVKYEAMFLDLTQMLEVANVDELVTAFMEKYECLRRVHLSCLHLEATGPHVRWLRAGKTATMNWEPPFCSITRQ